MLDSLIRDPFWAGVFLFLGCAFLFLEIFIPSGGILGTIAVVSTAFGVFGFFYGGYPVYGVCSLLGFLVYSGIVLLIVLRRVSFRGSLPPETSTSVDDRIDNLVGQEGVTLTALRPAGMATINGRKVDVVSLGGFIEKDIVVEVVDISGNRVVVREIEGRSTAS